MKVVHGANLAVRFLVLELGALAIAACALAIELTILGAAAAAPSASIGRETLAIGFAALAVLSGTLNYRWSS